MFRRVSVNTGEDDAESTLVFAHCNLVVSSLICAAEDVVLALGYITTKCAYSETIRIPKVVKCVRAVSLMMWTSC